MVDNTSSAGTPASQDPQTRSAPPAPIQSRGLDPFTALRRQMDRLFEDFSLSWPSLGLLEPVLGRAGREWIGGNWGATDVAESDANYRIAIELPGCKDEDLNVSVAGETISVSGKKTKEEREEQERVHSSGRYYGSFQQSFQIPAGVDPEGLTASFKNGVLEIVLPKTEVAKARSRTIPIARG